MAKLESGREKLIGMIVLANATDAERFEANQKFEQTTQQTKDDLASFVEKFHNNVLKMAG